MQISQALGLNRRQSSLDFVDIHLFTDTELFLDPAALYEGTGRFAEDCSRDLETFFEALLEAAGKKNWTLGLSLLRGLGEPDETQLGFSKGLPAGRGVGEKQAIQIFEAILQSKAVATGFIRDLNDALMFIPGIGPDKVSDITTNVVRRHLINYTQQQFDLLGIDIDTEMPTGLIWDSVGCVWKEGYDRIPVVKNRKILLVPKRYVKYGRDFTRAGQQYYDGYVASFIRQRELDSMGKLVKFREWANGEQEPWVYKQDIEKNTPRNKNSMADFSMNHPEVYDKFKNAFFKFSPMSIHAIATLSEDNFDDGKVTAGLKDALLKIPTGARDASPYQSLIIGILHFVFYPSLSNPVLEREINTGRKRIDISFENAASGGIFSRLRQDPFFIAREIMIECKNYSQDLGNPEIDQLIGRFDPRRGRFGIVVCRSIENKGKLLARCTDAFQSQQGAVVVLTDADLIEVLDAGVLGREARMNEIISSQLHLQRG